MKFITNKFALLFLLMLFVNVVTQAQEIIKDSVVEPVKKVTSGKRLKIDGVIATVGDYIILDSDIDKSFLELSTNGNSVKDITRCQMLGKLLEDKLYAHQAIQDSIVVTDAEIKGVMEEKLDFIVSKIGSIDKVVEYYKKNSEEELKSYFFDILKEQKLSAEMQKKIVEEVEITPEEVRNFFKGIPKDELPLFGAEMEVAQIVVTPKISEAEKQKVRDKLIEFKKDVLAGSSFYQSCSLFTR